MFLSLFKIALRHIYSNKVFSGINIIGLSIGLSASLVIGLLIYYDLSFDRFHPNGDRIYRITSTFTSNEGTFTSRGTAIPLGLKVRTGMAGIEKATTFYSTRFRKVSTPAQARVFKNIDDIVFTDDSYFNFFQYRWLAGNPSGILTDPNEIVLTQDRAGKYFPGLNPGQVMGQTLLYNDTIAVKVVGVVEDFEARTDFDFREFLSYGTARNTGLQQQVLDGNWNSTNSASQLFVMLHNNSVLPQMKQELNKMAKEHADPEMVSKGYHRTFDLQPLKDIHFSQENGAFNHSDRVANSKVLVSLACVALFLLLLGCFNFINLNTAQAIKRAKEIGIRKTLGSSKKQLVYQFVLETALLTIGAALTSIALCPALLRVFSDYLPAGIDMNLLWNAPVVISVLLLLASVTLISSLYPAFVLSGFSPVRVLRNQILIRDSRPVVRKYLTVFQFTIAQVLIIATLLVGKQLNYMLDKEMGFNTHAVAYIRTWDDEDYQKRLRFVDLVKTIPQISMVSLGGDPPASGNINSDLVTLLKDDREVNTELQFLYGDSNYRKLYGIELLAGRDRLNDTIEEFVINETYSKVLGFTNPADAVGQMVHRGDSLRQIVGVMPDFHQRALTSEITPMALTGDTNTSFYRQFNTVHLLLESSARADWPAILDQVRSAYQAIYADSDFEVNFVDDSIAYFYEQERKSAVLLNWSAGLAILISCLGLFGLVIYTTERRIKEIGVRKVLGATILQLNTLLCREFLVLVGIAFIIAAPISWWGLHHWLEGYAFRTNMSWWVFVLGAVIMILTSVAIMCLRTIHAANANPVKSLRSE